MSAANRRRPSRRGAVAAAATAIASVTSAAAALLVSPLPALAQEEGGKTTTPPPTSQGAGEATSGTSDAKAAPRAKVLEDALTALNKAKEDAETAAKPLREAKARATAFLALAPSEGAGVPSGATEIKAALDEFAAKVSAAVSNEPFTKADAERLDPKNNGNGSLTAVLNALGGADGNGGAIKAVTDAAGYKDDAEAVQKVAEAKNLYSELKGLAVESGALKEAGNALLARGTKLADAVKKQLAGTELVVPGSPDSKEGEKARAALMKGLPELPSALENAAALLTAHAHIRTAPEDKAATDGGGKEAQPQPYLVAATVLETKRKEFNDAATGQQGVGGVLQATFTKAKLPDAPLSKLLDAFAADLRTRAQLAGGTATAIRNLADGSRQEGDKALREGQSALRDAAQIEEALWPKVAEALKSGKFPDPLNAEMAEAARGIDGKVGDLRKARQEFAGGLSVLTDLLAGDIEKFVGDQVRLFYFTDIKRLLAALNQNDPQVYNPEAFRFEQEFETLRKRLRETDAGLAAARAEAAAATRRVQRIDEELRRADAEQARAVDRALRADTLVKQAQKAYEAVAPATKEEKPSDEAIRLEAVLNRQKAAKSVADGERTAAEESYRKLRDEKEGLPARREAALLEMETAEREVARLRREVALLAPQEAEAFGQARDNAPFYYSLPRADSPDPAKRVFLYAYPDSKILYIRGLREDVLRVKEIVAQFDRPAPQSLVTLWTLQLNGTNTAAINEQAAKIGTRIRAIRSDTALLQQALRSAIADEVARIQREVEPSQAGRAFHLKGRTARYLFYSPDVLRSLGFAWAWPEQRYPFDPNNPGSQHAPPEAQDVARATEYLTRWTLPDPAQATTLGEMLFTISLARRSSRRQVLYDFLENLRTYFVTTNRSEKGSERGKHEFQLAAFFGRSLVQMQDILDPNVLAILPEDQVSAANQKRRRAALPLLAAEDMKTEKQLAQRIKEALKDDDVVPYAPQFIPVVFGDVLTRPAGVTEWHMNLDDLDRGPDRPFHGEKEKRAREAMRATALGLQGDGTPVNRALFGKGDEYVTSNQSEIVLALKAKARADLAGAVVGLLKQIDSLPAEQRFAPGGLASRLRLQYLPLLGWLWHQSAGEIVAGNGAAGAPPPNPSVIGWLRLGLHALGRPTEETQLPDDETALREMDRAAFALAQLQGRQNPLSAATGRVAAADEMIKRLINAVEGDVDHFLVQPALKSINDNLSYRGARSSGVSLGAIQRESILATNRLVARVDPVASADLSPDEAENLSETATMLASLIDRKAAADQGVGGLTQGIGAALLADGVAGANALTTAGLGLLPVLSGLLTPPPGAPQGEVYSVNTGNLFKITPIFDPSGQAMRFRFDFTSSTRVQEPNGTVARKLPMIERHTVNTEVQLTNLELREISRFDTNVQAGLPETRTGGIPGLRELPVFRDLPLVGYFVRQPGKRAVRQESLILAQSVIYPTVADIADLLTEASAGGLPIADDSDLPGYLADPPFAAAVRQIAQAEQSEPPTRRLRVVKSVPPKLEQLELELEVRREFTKDAPAFVTVEVTDAQEKDEKNRLKIGKGPHSLASGVFRVLIGGTVGASDATPKTRGAIVTIHLHPAQAGSPGTADTKRFLATRTITIPVDVVDQ